MTGKRRFDDPCGVARALGVVGERWALLVVRELLLGPKRFTDLSRGLPGLSQNVLSQRLRDLEEAGVVHKRRLGPPVSATAYELTDLGQLLDPVIMALAVFGSRLPLPQTSTPMSADAFVLALRTTFDADGAKGIDATYELRLDDDVFHASIRRGRFEIARGADVTHGSGVRPHATLTGRVAALRSVVFGGRTLTQALRAKDLHAEGDLEAAQRFVTVFPRPRPA